ncbi:hypothetical protein ACFZAM_31630 [Streptomyces sp. NPDC008079]|uniref:hypothetical protein n=1 Tax=Streptomyces sp. NPDC008079 TaxID=3364806 RepID=UPI0036E967A0
MPLGFSTEEIAQARQREAARTDELANSLAKIVHEALRKEDAVDSVTVIPDAGENGRPGIAVELIDGTAFILPVNDA